MRIKKKKKANLHKIDMFTLVTKQGMNCGENFGFKWTKITSLK